MAPYVAMYKAVTQGRHLHHITERWAQQHEDGIQQAFFNGAGFESWENVWGIWNGITERNSELLRRAASILRWPLTSSQVPSADMRKAYRLAPKQLLPQEN